MDHLLFHCKFSNALRSEVFEVFGIQWVILKTVSSLLLAWRKLVWKSPVNYIEYGPSMFNAVSLAGT